MCGTLWDINPRIQSDDQPYHFLITPARFDSISFASKVIGSRYAQNFNKNYKRTGTLWEGRHKSSLTQSERYFLTCSLYIELNPVAAIIVTKPEQYRLVELSL